MKQIFFRDKLFVFLPSTPEDEEAILTLDNIESLDPAKLVEKVGNNNTLWIVSPEWEAQFDHFCAQFPIAEAGGGLIRNAEGEVLMMERNGWWDLPKGHLEAGESIEECALREVEEEVGLDCQIVRPLTPTMHFHRAYGHWEIKRTHWFVMDYEGDKTPTPQQEEGINQVVWLCGTELFDKVVSTYSTIRSLFMEYFNTEAAIAMQEELLNEN